MSPQDSVGLFPWPPAQEQVHVWQSSAGTGYTTQRRGSDGTPRAHTCLQYVDAPDSCQTELDSRQKELVAKSACAQVGMGGRKEGRKGERGEKGSKGGDGGRKEEEGGDAEQETGLG